MCKIITFNIKKPVDNTFKTKIDRAIELVTESEKSGYGVTLVYSNSIQFYKTKNIKQKFLTKNHALCKNHCESTIVEPIKYNELKTVIVHGRTSTNEISIEATHPIIHNENYFSHNGVISSKDKFTDLKTRNDSELLLRSFLKHSTDLEKFNSAITGYAAFFNASLVNNSAKISFYKDSTAYMYLSESEYFDCFATSSYHALDLTKIEPLEVLNNIFIDDILTSYNYLEHSGLKYSDHEASFASKSLGFELLQFNNEGLEDSENSLYDDSENKFFEELYQYADSTYTAFNTKTNEQIAIDDLLELDEKTIIKNYVVLRPDGTILSPTDYYTDKLYFGGT